MGSKKTFRVILILLAFLVAGGIALMQKYRQTNSSNSVSSEKQNGLNTFISERVPLSFQYPKDFPVNAVREIDPQQAYISDKTPERVIFTTATIPGNSGDEYGYILVSSAYIIDLKSYITNMFTSPSIENLTIEEVAIGDKSGYRLNVKRNQEGGGVLGSQAEWTYYYYSPDKNLLYQAAITNPDYNGSDSQETNRIFEEIILPSMRFE